MQRTYVKKDEEMHLRCIEGYTTDFIRKKTPLNFRTIFFSEDEVISGIKKYSIFRFINIKYGTNNFEVEIDGPRYNQSTLW